MSGDFKFIFHCSSGTSPLSGEDWRSGASWRRTAVSETPAESRLHPLQRGGFGSTKVSWSQTSQREANAGDSSKGTVAMPQHGAQLINAWKLTAMDPNSGFGWLRRPHAYICCHHLLLMAQTKRRKGTESYSCQHCFLQNSQTTAQMFQTDGT